MGRLKKLMVTHPERTATVMGWYQQFASILSGILLVPFVITYLGNEKSGLWFALQGLTAAFAIADFGFSMAITRQVAHTLNHNEQEGHSPDDLINDISGLSGVSKIFRSGRTIFIGVKFISFTLFLLSYPLVARYTNLFSGYVDDAFLIWTIMAVSILPAMDARLYQGILEGYGYMPISRFIIGTYQLVNGLLSFVVLLNGFDILGIVSVSIISLFIQEAVLRVMAKRLCSLYINNDAGNAVAIRRKLIQVSIPFGVMSAGVYLVGSAQFPLLGMVLGASSIPSIYIAFRISQVMNSVVLQYISAQQPSFIKDCATSQWLSAKLRMRSVCAYGSLFQVFNALVLYYVSPFVVSWWLDSSEYIDGWTLLIFSINHLVTGVAGMPAQFVLSSGRNPFAITTILHGIFMLLGIIMLCPNLGVLGMPISALVAVLITNFWFCPFQGWKTFSYISSKLKRAYG